MGMDIVIGMSTFGATYVAELVGVKVHERTGKKNFDREFVDRAVHGQWAKSYGKKAFSTGTGTASIPGYDGLFEVQDWPSMQAQRRRYYRVEGGATTEVSAIEATKLAEAMTVESA